MWIIAIFIVLAFFIGAACLRPVIGEGFEWACWWPCRKRKGLWRKLRRSESDDEDDDEELEDSDRVDW